MVFPVNMLQGKSVLLEIKFQRGAYFCVVIPVQ